MAYHQAVKCGVLLLYSNYAASLSFTLYLCCFCTQLKQANGSYMMSTHDTIARMKEMSDSSMPHVADLISFAIAD